MTVTATNTEGSDSETFDLTVSGEFLFFLNNSTKTAVARDLDLNLVSTYNIDSRNWRLAGWVWFNRWILYS